VEAQPRRPDRARVQPGRVKGQVPDALIVAAARSPIGRAAKGSSRATLVNTGIASA
jgi:hypothetical protein